MKLEDIHIDDLIINYLTEGLDKDSLQILDNWRMASPANEQYFREQQEIWFSASVANPNTLSFDKDKAFENFRERVNKASAPKKPSLFLHYFWRCAAAIVIILSVSYFSYWRGESNLKESFANVIIEAPLGSRTKLNLPDGSMVWLNGGSRIVYSQGFGVDDRTIQMQGEGYFEVKRNEKLPFSVKTKDLQVNVLGTKFNFRNYTDDVEAIVSLLEGKVALTNLIKEGRELTMAPNERVILNKINGTMTMERIDPQNATVWTSGYLFFDEELLPDIIKELERSYNVRIQIDNDSLKKFRFYGNFVRRDQSIVEVLEVLASTGKLHYKIKGKEILIY